MSLQIVFATGNENKLREVKQLVAEETGIEIVGLDTVGITEEIPETGDTLEDNALEKAFYVADKCEEYCISDDTGLLVDALDGRPGVYSARYAGEHCSADENIDKLLSELEGVEDRSARFRTIIALVMDGVEYLFGGEVEGSIATERKGEGGFGYDPVFIPSGYDISFSEMTPDQKNSISHRGLALQGLVKFLKEINPY